MPLFTSIAMTLAHFFALAPCKMDRPTQPIPKTATFEFSGGILKFSVVSDFQKRSRLTDTGGLGEGTEASSNTTAQQASLVQRSLWVNSYDGNIGYHGVLGKGRGSHLKAQGKTSTRQIRISGRSRNAHKVVDVLAFALESNSAVGHDTLTLGGSNSPAQVGLPGLAEFAFSALYRPQGESV